MDWPTSSATLTSKTNQVNQTKKFQSSKLSGSNLTEDLMERINQRNEDLPAANLLSSSAKLLSKMPLLEMLAALQRKKLRLNRRPKSQLRKEHDTSELYSSSQ